MKLRSLIIFPMNRNTNEIRIDLKIAEGRQQEVPVLETVWWNPARSMAPFARKFPVVELLVGRNWQEGAFGREVRQYAPWVFELPSH
jgi:hypothetical protein